MFIKETQIKCPGRILEGLRCNSGQFDHLLNRGSGSYTCLSFGAPQKPIFAFHTIQDEDGVVFGTGSGFPDENEILSEAENSVNNIRKIRKIVVSKEFLEKGRSQSMEGNMKTKSYDFNSQKRKRMVSYPTINGLPITAYQEKLLLESDSEQLLDNLNDKKMKQSEPENESVSVQKYEYPL